LLCLHGGRLSSCDNVHVIRSFEESLQVLSSLDASGRLERAFIIGGEVVYQVCCQLELSTELDGAKDIWGLEKLVLHYGVFE